MALDTEGEVRALQQQMALVARIVLELPLETYIEKCNRADALGPLLDPTLWIKGHKPMDQWRRVAQALRKAQLALEPLRDEIIQEDGG